MFASAHPGEEAKDSIKHFLLAFSMLEMLEEIKTDKGPEYVSARLRDFFQQWGVKHSTGIPHSPKGQSVVKWAHQTLKRLLHQQQGGSEDNSPIA